jgi:hypothetical protein
MEGTEERREPEGSVWTNKKGEEKDERSIWGRSKAR